jgi:hypothetical protein
VPTFAKTGGKLGRQLEYKQIWAGGLVEYQSEAYSGQQCPAWEYTSPLNRKTQEAFACVSPTCGFSANADDAAAQNQGGRMSNIDSPHVRGIASCQDCAGIGDYKRPTPLMLPLGSPWPIVHSSGKRLNHANASHSLA